MSKAYAKEYAKKKGITLKDDEEKKTVAKKPQSSSVKKVNQKASNSTFMGGGAPVKKVEQKTKGPTEQKLQQIKNGTASSTKTTRSNTTVQRQTDTGTGRKRTQTTAAQRQKMGMPTSEDISNARASRRAALNKVDDFARRTTARAGEWEKENLSARNPMLETQRTVKNQKAAEKVSERMQKRYGKQTVDKSKMQGTALGRTIGNASDRWVEREKGILLNSASTLADFGDILNDKASNKRGRIGEDFSGLLPDAKDTKQKMQLSYKEYAERADASAERLSKLTDKAASNIVEKKFYEAEDVAQGMISDKALSLFTGGNWAIPLFARTYSQAKRNAEAAGATQAEARAAGLWNSAVEIATEGAGGYFGKGDKLLGKVGSKLENRIVNRFEGESAKKVASFLARWERNNLEESLEEVIGNPLQNAGENVIYRNRLQQERQAEEDARLSELGSSIQKTFAENPTEVENYIAELNSPDTRASFVRDFMNDNNLSEEQAKAAADKMLSFMEAAAMNDTQRMKEISASLSQDLAGDVKKKVFDWNDTLNSILISHIVGVGSGVNAASTMAQGQTILNDPNSKTAMQNALRKTAAFDKENSAKAKGLLETMERDDYKPTPTQAFDIMANENGVMAESAERQRAAEQVKEKAIRRENLSVPVSTVRSDGKHIITGQQTTERYVNRAVDTFELIDAINSSIYNEAEKVSDEVTERMAEIVPSFDVGTLDISHTADLTTDHAEERYIFKEMTGVDLDQFNVYDKNGKLDTVASNIKMQEGLLALSAQNYIESARIEQEAWNDQARGEIADALGSRFNPMGDIAIHDALNSVDPRDQAQFMLMTRVAQDVYRYSYNTQDEWQDVKRKYQKMYPSLDVDALEGMYESAKEDKAEAETPYLNYEVKVGEALNSISKGDATPQIRGKFVNETSFNPETGEGITLPESDRIVYASLAKGINANITMIDAQDERLAYIDENGNTQYNNASVDLATGDILISNAVDAGTAVHEVTHVGARLASRYYRDLADYIFDKAYKYDPEKTMRILDAYRRTYADQNLSDAKLKEEVVSDLVATFQDDPRFARDISQDNPSLVRKIINAIEDLLRNLRNILATGKIQDPAVQNSFLVEIGAYEEARRMWLEMYREAQKNNAALGLAKWHENAIRDNRIANARHTNVEQAEKERELFLRDSEGNGLTERQAQIVHDIGPDIRFSRPTFLNDLAKGKYYANMNNGKGGFAGLSEIASGKDILKRTMQKNGFSENQTDAVVGFLSHMADYLDSDELQMRYSFIGWQDLSDAEITVRRDKDDNIIGVAVSAMVVNGEYPVNFDMTTICNKREGVMEVIQELTRKFDADTGRTILNSVKLTDEKMWSINKALKAEGIDTACLGCFVEARRYYTNRFIDKIDDVWNSAVRDARRQLGLPEEEYFNFAKGKKVSGEDYNKISDLWTAYDESTESKRSPSQRIKILMDEIVRNKEVDSPYLKLISAEDILTPEGISGFKKISTKDRDMVKMIKSIYGTSAPKEILAFTPYNSEIALLPDKIKGMETGEYLKSIGGTRVQSFSDFKMAHMFDHMQMVADEAARGFVNHGYSKVIAYPRLFGLTGRKINMSVMFDVLPASTWQATLGCSEEAAKEIADRYQGLRFVKEKPAENPDNRPYIETEIEGVHGYLTYLVSDADYVNSVFDELYQQYLAEGMDEDTARREANKAKPFEQSINYREAVDLENQEGYKENVGIIAVAYGNEHLKMLLDDPNVRYIIPYHRSGLPVFIAQKTALDIAKDYTDFQNTRKAKGGLWTDAEGNKVRLKNKYAKWKEEHADEAFPAIAFFRDEIGDYTFEPGKLSSKDKVALAGTGTFDVYENLDKVSDIREISNAYLEHCINNNQVPIFHEFAGHDNYYKMLFDFAVTDAEGNIYPQRPVRNVYPGLDIDAKAAAGEEITEEDYAEFYKAIEEGLQTENAKNELRSNRLGKVLDEDLLSREGENSIIADSNIQHIVNGTPDYTDPKSSDVANSRLVSNEELAARDDVAIFIKNTKQVNYIDLIFKGEKTEETRPMRTLDKFIGKEVAVTDGKKVYGTVVLGEPHKYSAEEFRSDKAKAKHHVPDKDDEYSAAEGKGKWAYPIESYSKYDEPKVLSDSKDYARSYQAREMKFSRLVELDEPYMQAVNSGNMDEAQRLVDEAAMTGMPNLAKTTRGRMTKPLKLYHGTPSFGFTQFKDSNYEVPFIYTSTDRTVSAHYAGDQHYASPRPIGKPYREGDSIDDLIENAKTVWQTNYHVMTSDEKKARYNEVIDEAKKIADKIDELSVDVPFDSFAEGDDYSFANAVDNVKYLFWVARDMDDDFYYNFDEDNGYREESVQYHQDAVDGFERNIERVREYYHENRNNLTDEQKKLLSYLIGYEVGDAAIDMRFVLKVMTEENRLINEYGGVRVPSEMKETMDSIHNIAAYELYGDLGEKPFEFDAGGAQWYGLKVPEVSDDYVSTDQVCKWAYENGYTSVIMHNIYDYGDKADNYVFFNSSQLKSADPVTYAEDGSVIPLSERFDPTNNDIRYSRPTIDAEGNILTDGQMEYFKNSQAVDEQGRLVPVYHTTNDGGFTVFDPYYSDDHRCLFFSSDYYVSQSYGEDAEQPIDINRGVNEDGTIDVQQGYYKVYLNLENPMVIDGQGQDWDDITIGKRVLPKDSHIEIYSKDYLAWSADNDDYLYKMGQAHRDGSRQRSEIAEMGDSPSAVLKFENGERIVVKADNKDTLKESVAKTLSEHYNVSEDAVWKVANTLVTRMGLSVNNGHTWLNSSMINQLTGETHTTREWAEIAQAQGHDGVIFRNIVDIGSWDFFSDEIESDIYVAFSSNQVKDINNENPTENPDIRYSRTVDDEADAYTASQFALDNSYEALKYYEETIGQIADEDYEAAYLKAKKYAESDIDKFYNGLTAFADDYRSDDPVIEEGRNTMAKSKQEYFNSLNAKWNDRWRTEGTVLEAKSVKKPIRDLVSAVMKNSDTDHVYRTEIVNRALIDTRLAYDLAKRGREDVAYALLWHSALKMIDGVEFYADDGAYEAYKEMRDFFKETKISLGKEYWSDVKFGEFRKRNMSRIKLVKGNTNVDSVYRELQDRWPEWFDEEEVMTPPDQLLQIEHVLDSIQPYKEAYSSEEVAELATDIATDLFGIMTEGRPVVSLADRYDQKTDELKGRQSERIRNLREQQKASYDRKTKALKVRHAEAMIKVRQQRDEAVRKTNEKWTVREEKRKERLAHNEAYESIQKSYNELYKRLTTNTVDKHIPEQYKQELADLLLAFDLQSVRSKQLEAKRGYQAKNTIKLAEMRSVLKKIGNRAELFTVNDSITDIIDDLLGENDAYFSHSIEGETIDELSASELKKIDKLFQSLIHEFNNYEKVRVKSKKAQAADLGHAMVDSCLDHRAIFGEGKDYQGLMGALDRIPNLDEMTAAYLFRRIDPNGVGMRIMFDEINRSFDHYVKNTEQLQEWMDDILGEYQNHGRGPNKYGADQIAEWRNPHSKQRIYLEKGMVELTPAQMMSLYCLSKRAQAHDHMTGAGIVIAPVTFNAKKLSDLKPKSTRTNLPQKLTDYDIERIIEHLTPDQIKVAEKLQELMATKMADWGNEASMNVIGIKLFEDPNYFPIWSDKRALTRELNEDQFVEAIRNFGFTKAVQPGARNAIMIDDIFTIVSEHCNNMNLYNSYSESMNDFMKVYNYRDFREDGSEYTVQQAIANAYSQKATTFIMQFMKDLNGNVSGSNTGITSTINGLLANAKKASVFANVRVLLQQPTAITRAFAVIDPKYLKGINLGDAAKGMIPTVTTEAMKEMFEHCPRAWWKAQGYYDINMGKSVEDVMMNNGSFWDDLATSMYGKADNITWTAIWQMCKAEVEDKHKDVEKGSDEYWELCNERMTEVVDLTQVMDSPIHRSHGMRSKDIIMKSFTSFMAEPTLTFNMLKAGVTNGIEEIKAGNTAKGLKILGRTASVLVLQAATVSAAAALWDAVRGKNGDDDDEEKQTYLALWWINFIENLKGEGRLWNKVYFLKDIDSVMSGYEFNNLAIQGFKMIRDGWNQLTGSKRVYSSKKWYENLFGGIGYLFGVPVKTIIQDVKAVYHMFGADWKFANDFGEYLDSMAKKPSSKEDKETPASSFANIFSEDEADEEGSWFDPIARKMGYKPIGTSAKESVNTAAESKPERETESTDYEAELQEYRESLSDNYSDEQKDKLVKQYKKKLESETNAEYDADMDVQEHVRQGLINFEFEMEKRSLKAAENAAGLSGNARNNALWDVISEGYTNSVASGNMATIQAMKDAFVENGGDADWFDAKITDKMKSEYKKTIVSDPSESPGAWARQARMRNYMTQHGVSDEEISEIVRKTYTARDLKAAMRMGVEEYIVDELKPLIRAGLTREDYEYLYKYRNYGAKSYDGKYTDPKYMASTGTFIWPTEGVITSHFGYRNAPTAGASSNHPAIDIGAPTGTDVVAADGGVVIYAGSNYGYGNSVGIKHDNGMVTYYNHLSAWAVNVGDRVMQGQPIASVGSTGISTGPHLDFKILDADGNPVDPEKYLGK